MGGEGRVRGRGTERDFKYAFKRLQPALTCSNQTVEPARRVIKVVCNQRIGTAEQVQQHKEVLERKSKEKGGSF